MVNAINPVADPIGFILFFFIFGVGDDLIGTVLKLTVLSSVIVFPFTIMGRWIYGKVEERVKSPHLAVLFLTSLITVFLFVIVIRLWYVLFGSSFLAIGLSDFLIGFTVALVISFLFALLGDFINHVIHQNWKVPQMLSLYVIDLIVSLVFFIMVVVAIYASGA